MTVVVYGACPVRHHHRLADDARFVPACELRSRRERVRLRVVGATDASSTRAAGERHRDPSATSFVFVRDGWRWRAEATGMETRWFWTERGCRRFAASLGRNAAFFNGRATQ
jgi:hypothetical protein